MNELKKQILHIAGHEVVIPKGYEYIHLVMDDVYSWKRMVAKTYKGRTIYYPPQKNKQRAWDFITTFLKSEYAFVPQINKPIRLYIAAYDAQWKHDVDNIAKMVMDSLQPLVIGDDHLVHELHVYKMPIPSTPQPQTHIFLIYEHTAFSSEFYVFRPKIHKEVVEELVADGGLFHTSGNNWMRVAVKYNKFFIRINNTVIANLTFKQFSKHLYAIIEEYGDEWYLIRGTNQKEG